MKRPSNLLSLAAAMMLGIIACVTEAPIEEYVLARAALESSRAVDAGRYSSGFYHRGLEAYAKAEILYKDREYPDAKALFHSARLDFEKAENSAQVQRKKNGEVP